MRPFRDVDQPLEKGWILEGEDAAGHRIRLGFGETELGRAYLGIVVGRHPALCERVLSDETISRRHFRIGLAEGEPFIEDLNSLNGTRVDGADLHPFRPSPLVSGQRVLCGRIRLTLRYLSDRSVIE